MDLSSAADGSATDGPGSLASRAATGAVVGAAAGAAATVPMSAVMLLAQRLGLMGAQPPQRITDGGLDALGATPSRPARRALAVLSHLGFGAAAGAPFGLLQRLSAGRAPAGALPPEVLGAAYGLGVWASAYLGWVPAAGLMPPAHRDRPGRPASMVVAHLVWGFVLAAATTRLAARVPWAPTRGAGLRPVPGAPRA